MGIIMQEPTPPGSTQSKVSLGERRITGEFVELKNGNGNGNTNGNGVGLWLKMASVGLAVAVAIGTLSAAFFYEKAAGKALEVKVDANEKAQTKFETRVDNVLQSIENKLERIDKKLDRRDR